jgi:hypothetical protein
MYVSLRSGCLEALMRRPRVSHELLWERVPLLQLDRLRISSTWMLTMETC